MNNKRRSMLDKAINHIKEAHEIIYVACEEEQGCLDNIPDSLQESTNFYKMENSIDKMNEAIDRVDEVEEYIEIAKGQVRQNGVYYCCYRWSNFAF